MIGGALNGISGLFLSIPAIAFIKIICDQINSKPGGMLMGDDTTYSGKSHLYKKLQKLSKLKAEKVLKVVKDIPATLMILLTSNLLLLAVKVVLKFNR